MNLQKITRYLVPTALCGLVAAQVIGHLMAASESSMALVSAVQTITSSLICGALLLSFARADKAQKGITPESSLFVTILIFGVGILATSSKLRYFT